MTNLLILGAGGHGHVVAETARAMRYSDGNPIYNKIDFLDDLKSEALGKLQDLPLLKKEYQEVFPAVGTVCKSKTIWFFSSSVDSSRSICQSVGNDW